MARICAVKQAFLQNCQDITRKSRDVSIDFDKLKTFAHALKAPTGGAPDWNEYLSAETASAPKPDFPVILAELARITAQNGGYLYQDHTGKTAKWQIDGSGAKALVALFNDLRADSRAPLDFSGKDESAAALTVYMKDLPYGQERLHICREFTGPDVISKMADILAQSKKDQTGTYRFDMKTIQNLADHFPKSFGDDPLYKKAILTCLMAASHARSRGIDVDLDLPVAADYRLPETLHAAGVLKFSPALAARINRDELLDEHDPVVSEMRVATIVAVDDICRISGLTIDQVDLALWMASRDGTLDRLQQENAGNVLAKKHFSCRTLWF
ncbi:MAG: queuosine salvage family protein [Pseudomonadota bacterium]